MMVQATVQPNYRQLNAIKKGLQEIPRQMPRLMSRGVNTTTRRTKTNVGREIRQAVPLKASAVNARIEMALATRSANPEAKITVKSGDVPLIALRASQTKKGVTYKTQKAGSRQLEPGAFIATMPSGHRGVFKRKGTARLPIRELFLSRVTGNNDDLVIGAFMTRRRQIMKVANLFLGKETNRLIALEMEKRSG